MQTKKLSLLETLLNVGSGLFISYLTWVFIVAPVWGFELPTHEVFAINIIFTVISILRGYVWRRLFNKIT